MPTKVRPSTVIVTNTGDGHLKITLELNININSSGVQSVGEVQVSPEKEFEFVVPEFDHVKKLEFGKEV